RRGIRDGAGNGEKLGTTERILGMQCARCGCELPNGRGAYRWRSEFTALGSDAITPATSEADFKAARQRILEQLERFNAERIEQDVYQLIEKALCRSCRMELGELLNRFLNSKQ
ncbi:MAG: hypothetical protein ABH878_10355, partial [bacterium]